MQLTNFRKFILIALKFKSLANDNFIKHGKNFSTVQSFKRTDSWRGCPFIEDVYERVKKVILAKKCPLTSPLTGNINVFLKNVGQINCLAVFPLIAKNYKKTFINIKQDLSWQLFMNFKIRKQKYLRDDSSSLSTRSIFRPFSSSSIPPSVFFKVQEIRNFFSCGEGGGSF